MTTKRKKSPAWRLTKKVAKKGYRAGKKRVRWGKAGQKWWAL